MLKALKKYVRPQMAGVCLCLIGLALIGYYFWKTHSIAQQENSSESYNIIYEEVSPDNASDSTGDQQILKPGEAFPVGELIITEDRKRYENGDMQIYIPRLNYKGDILNGTDDATLNQGIGLFEYSQMPGGMELNANVSVAGHRDMGGREFYNIHKITEGDYIYLSYQDTLYTYLFIESFETDRHNWDPIRVRAYPCITMQSCTPIGISTSRIFVVGRLVDIIPSADFDDIPVED